MPTSLVAVALQGNTAGHPAQNRVTSKSKIFSARLDDLNHLIELKPRSTRMEPGRIAVTDGTDEIGFHFSVREEFSVKSFNVYDGDNQRGHGFIHVAGIKGGLEAFLGLLAAYEYQARGCTIAEKSH